MAGIQAEPDGDVGQLGGELAHYMQLFESPAELRPSANRILDQQHQLPQFQSARRLSDPFQKMHDPLLDGVALVVPGMCDQVFRANRHRAD